MNLPMCGYAAIYENVKIYVDSAEIPGYPLKRVVAITSGWKDGEMRKARRRRLGRKEY